MRSILSVVLLLALITAINATVNATTRKIVEDALLQALLEASASTDQSVTDGSIVDSQIANSESKQLQLTGDVLEAATQILVAEYGIGILDEANEVLAELNAESTTEESS